MQKQSLHLNDFNMLSLIGIGNYAKVVLVRKKSSGKLYAMKIMKKRMIDQDYKDSKYLKTQAFIQKQILIKCQHPFIVNLHGTFQHHRKLYYILQYCPGGQLFGVLKRNTRLSQQSAKFYASQILLALEYLHSENYLYRDLKPENILIDKQGYIRLVDFGLSCYLKRKKDDVFRISGTPQYLPPETFSKTQMISSSIDWWSFGSLIFEMTVGFPPFYSYNQSIREMKQKILQDNNFLNYINSPVLKDLLSKLMHKDPEKRLGYRQSTEVIKHQWFANVNWQRLLKKQAHPPFIPEINSEDDTRWFDMETDHSLTPPQKLKQSDKDLGQKYNSFSLSWKSSKSPQKNQEASPVEEIQIKVEQSGQNIHEIHF